MKISIPKNVEYIIDTMYECGYEAFIVGGCVRDSLLGEKPNDYDITTNATPNKIIEIFKDYRIIDNGIKHGTVGVVIDEEVYEITTYRIENEYQDNRRPKSVEFTSKIEKDLERRDFTINAIAYNNMIGIIDEFDGKEDLKHKIIKTVGSPDERFTEDGLRMMRAIRFSCKLGFTLEEKTLESIYRNSNIIKNISVERITEEFTKTLLSNNLDNIELLYKTGIFKSLNIHTYMEKYYIDQNDIKILKECVCILEERLIILEYLISNKILKDIKDEDEKIRYYKEYMQEKSIINKLVYPNKIKSKCNMIIEFMILEQHDLDKVSIKKLLNKISKENLEIAIKLKKVYYNNFIEDNTKNKAYLLNKDLMLIEEIENNNECYTIRDLDIDGNVLRELGYKGLEIGRKLEFLLEEVINNPDLNKKDKLIDILNNKKRSNKKTDY